MTIRQQLLRRKLSGWLRMARFRSSFKDDYVNLSMARLWEIATASDYKCAYCGEMATSGDMPFPLLKSHMLVAANAVLICDGCRIKKRKQDIVGFFNDVPKVQAFIRPLLKREGGGKLREYILGRYG